MRVTPETKEATRKKILETADELFRRTGFETTTTRDIARAAGIATGTLFNYFPTKEAIALTLIAESRVPTTRKRGAAEKEEYASLEEALFAHAAASLRQLKPYRSYLAPVLDTTLSPMVAGRDGEVGQLLRTEHLERIVVLARQYQLDEALTPIALQMYWTLYLGMLSFWLNDNSPKQEDTLALLDQSMEMFVQWLTSAKSDAVSDSRAQA